MLFVTLAADDGFVTASTVASLSEALLATTGALLGLTLPEMPKF